MQELLQISGDNDIWNEGVRTMKSWSFMRRIYISEHPTRKVGKVSYLYNTDDEHALLFKTCLYKNQLKT